jgi:NAD(P)-dependent dehydrogenase (short-subunit alcohol dehydrogenase family)
MSVVLNHKWTIADMPNLTGKTAVVTGSSSGIGLVTARELARAGANVVLAVRNPDKGAQASAQMPGRTEVRELDVSDLASVRGFAASWVGDLDILVNNAGIMLVPEGRTVDGFELHMGTNYFGAFALTNLLLPHMPNRSTSRVVSVSSQLHKGGHLRLDDLNGDHRAYNAMQAYRDSKLANIYFTTELQRRLDNVGSQIRAITAHPGIARTNLNDHVTGPMKVFARAAMWIFNDADHGAYPALYGATEDVATASYVGPDSLGHFRGDPEVHKPGRAARNNPKLGQGLWEISARLTGSDFPVLAL